MTDEGAKETSKESEAFQLLMDQISLAISNPENTAFLLYSRGIISKEKRDEIYDYEQTSRKKRALLRAMEDQIALTPEAYHKFCGILSQDKSNEFICQKMREHCPLAQSGHQKIGSSGNTATTSYPVSQSVQQPSSQNAEVFTASTMSADTTSSSAQLLSHPASSVKAPATIAPRRLTIEDLKEVTDALPYFSKWKPLGLNLGLHPNLLERIAVDKHNAQDQLDEVLRNWLCKNVMDKTKDPTWCSLAEAVDPIESALSDEIKKNHTN